MHRDLSDAAVDAVSEDRRFEAAFNAARSAASVALRASGYRTATQLGHHLKTIESLELTIGADASVVHKLRVFSKKRNATSYDSAGNISAGELDQAIELATELQQNVIAWLRNKHPELLD